MTTATQNPVLTLEEIRDDLCKNAPNEEYIMGLLDTYNEGKKRENKLLGEKLNKETR